MTHLLLMSFDNVEYMNLNKSFNRFIEYAFILTKKKIINFCYVGTASLDSFIERKFFSSFIRAKYGKQVHTSQLLLTKSQLNSKQLEDFIKEQDILFIGGGNTEKMLQIWEKSKFTHILNKLKDGPDLPILAGVSAGGMYPFHSGLTDSTQGYYKPLPCLQWIKYSFCPHSNSKNKAICAFKDNQSLVRMDAYISAIKAGILPEGYAVPDDCMLHFYNFNLVRALTSRENNYCYYVTQKTHSRIETELLTHNNIFDIIQNTTFQEVTTTWNHEIVSKINCWYYLFKFIHLSRKLIFTFKRLTNA